MRIIDTDRNLKIKILAIIILFGIIVAICANNSNITTAKRDADQANYYYRQAAAQYKKLIVGNKDVSRLYFELGKLYYDHGDFDNAADSLKKSKTASALRLLPIVYYRLGDYTSALDVFNKNDTGDDEYLYYKAMTEEKLNLFDKAIATYKNIKKSPFLELAYKRLDGIEKETKLVHIKDVDGDTARLLLESPGEIQYPQAGALILACNESVEIKPDATQLSQMHYLVKILNERGKEDFSEVQIEYDSTYEKVELEYARTIKPNGQVVDVGNRHIRDVSKYMNFPLYSNVRVYIISFPEIATGSAIEYKLKITKSQLINKKDFVLRYPLQTSEPVLDAYFKIKLPRSLKLNTRILSQEYNNFKAELKPESKEEDGALVYEWRFKNIPQLIPESNMPPAVEINPTMLFSTFRSWEDIYNWWWELAKNKISPDSAIKDKVKELTAPYADAQDKIRAIYNFCAKDIRYVAVEYGQAGFEPHQAADIFKNKYGDCKDQAVLLVTMLKEAGFDAYLVLIPTKDYYNMDKDFPSVLFDHCIAALKYKDSLVFMDPTAQTCSFMDLPAMDQGRSVLVFKDSGYEIVQTPLFAAEHNLKRQILNIKFNNDETIEAVRSIYTYGTYDQGQRWWLLYTTPELIGDKIKESIQGVCIEAKLKDYKIENADNLNKPVVLQYWFSGQDYLTRAGILRILPQLGGVDTSLVAKDERKYPIDFNILDAKEDIVDIELPDGLKVQYLPVNIQEENQWFSFLFEYTLHGNKIHFRQKTALKKNIITQQEYAAFKRSFQELARKTKQRAVLEKNK